jgi:hypothetical protein
MKLYLKKVKRNDENFLYKLRNESSIIRNSLNSSKITKVEHAKWFRNADKRSLILIAYLNKKRIGVVRLEKNDSSIAVSIALKSIFQKKSYGAELIKQSEKFIKKNTILIAKIKKQNIRSLKIFLKNNYSILIKNKLITVYKIFKKNSENSSYDKIISRIETIRKKNNINWMNILKLSFQLDSTKTKSIFKKIYFDDNKINKLSKKILK